MHILRYVAAASVCIMTVGGPALSTAGAQPASKPTPAKIVVRVPAGGVQIYENGGGTGPASAKDNLKTVTITRSKRLISAAFLSRGFDAHLNAKTVYEFISYLENPPLTRTYNYTVQVSGSNAMIGGTTGGARHRDGYWELSSLTYSNHGSAVGVACPGLQVKAGGKKRGWVESAPRTCFKHLNFHYNVSGEQRRQVYVSDGGSETFYDDYCNADACDE